MVGEYRMKRIILKKVTKEDIERNLNNLKEDKPLDIPLAILNGHFKKIYFNNKFNPVKIKCGYCGKIFLKKKRNIKFCSKECVKAKTKAYQKLDKYKAYMKAYQKSDKYKAYRKAYMKAYQKSDKYKAYKKAYYQRCKLKGKVK